MNEHAATTLSPDTRRARILHLLEREGEQGVEQLAERFSVSGMTIRRDLQDLADAGKVLRTHGGATPAARISFEFRFLERAQLQADNKAQIAEIAAGLVSPGHSVLLDSGTTTLAIARRLKSIGVGGITVITTSLPIASELFGVEGVDTILLGGQLRRDSPDLVGAITDHCLDVLRADIAFIGADAIDEHGRLYSATPEIARMLRRMAGAADRVFAVADHTKIGRHGFMQFGRLSDWQGLVTDNGLDRRLKRRLDKAGVRLLQHTRQGAIDR
jgi:DeoR family fructose operon transcriptional repressor